MECIYCKRWFASSNPERKECSACGRALQQLGIVQCKDCKHQITTQRLTTDGTKEDIKVCELNEDAYDWHAVEGEDYEFCSHGERREADHGEN